MKKFKSAIALLLALIMVVSCGYAVFATDLPESDSNNTAATATDFDLDDTVKGRIEEVSDVDYFTIDVEKAGIALITFSHDVVASSASYFSVKVLNEDLTVETDFTVAGTDETTLSTKFGIEKGVHYIVVSGGQVVSTTLDYKFSLSIDTEARAEKESNNTPATATQMDLSTSGNPKRYIGNLSQNDVDYFVVEVPKEGMIYLYLYNTNGKAGEYTAEVSKFIEGSGGVSSLKTIASLDILSQDRDSRSEPIGVGAGKYYIKITGTVGGYETRVFYAEATVTMEKEYNNETKYSEKIYVDKEKSITASLIDYKDVDYFKFTVEKGKKEYKFVVSLIDTVSTSARWTVTLRNSDDAVVSTTEVYSGVPAEIKLNDLDVGNYYIVVSTTESYHSAVRYKITTEDSPNSKSSQSFWEMLKNLDFSSLINSFKEWSLKLDYLSIIKSIVLSIKTIFGKLDL